jgi:DNA-binding transcriptional LysR family regulator
VLGRVDVVVGVQYDGSPRPRDAEIEREPLLRERVLLALPVAHRLAAAPGPVRLRDAADAVWAAGAEAGHADVVVRVCQELGGFHPDIRHASDDLLVLRALVSSGHALTLLPEFLARGRDDEMVLRPLIEGDVHREVFMASRRSAMRRPAVRVVRDAISDAARAVLSP